MEYYVQDAVMAYRDEKHAFEQLTEDMKKGDIPAVVVLRGKEEYLVDFYAKRLIDRFVTKESRVLDLTTIERDKATVDDIIGSLETMPFMIGIARSTYPRMSDRAVRMPKFASFLADDRTVSSDGRSFRPVPSLYPLGHARAIRERVGEDVFRCEEGSVAGRYTLTATVRVCYIFTDRVSARYPDSRGGKQYEKDPVSHACGGAACSVGLCFRARSR